MTPSDEKLLKDIKAACAAQLQKEVYVLQRKLKRALEQRDEWKYNAMNYRKRLLEKT